MNEKEKRVADFLLDDIMRAEAGVDKSSRIARYLEFIRACALRKSVFDASNADTLHTTLQKGEGEDVRPPNTQWFVMDVNEYGGITTFDGPHRSRELAIQVIHHAGETRRKLVLAEIEMPK